MRVHLCGVRGSTPAPGPEFVRYGGNTSSVAICRDGNRAPSLILDAGTGIRQVTSLLDGEPYAGPILLTHLHWDHVHGLPFFKAGDRPGARVRLLLPEQEDLAGAESVLERTMSPPHFPIRPGELRGDWTFETLPTGDAQVAEFTVLALEIPHKGGRTYGYRVSDGASVVAYLPDHCPTVLGGGPDGIGEYHDAAMILAAGADLLIHDASLTADEVLAEASFGHAAAEYAAGLGHAAGASRVVLFHHKPDRTDEELDKIVSRLSDSPVPVIMAAEQETLVL